jgi:ABC-type enterochelin transport system ATPase subunit
MIALIQEDLAGDQVQRVVLVLVLTITVGIIIKELWNLYQKHKCKTVNLYDNLKKIFIKSRVCSICKSNLSCMLSKSCMHMTTCQTCWEKQKEVCNECNRTVKDIVEMYVC